MERQCGRGVEDVGGGGDGVRQWWWIEEHVLLRHDVRDRGPCRLELQPDDDPGKKNGQMCCVGGDRREGHVVLKGESVECETDRCGPARGHINTFGASRRGASGRITAAPENITNSTSPQL
jgi:hypothetical protein